MRNPVDEDQREKTVMEEPTTITIEFLRARLLSERSISRAATERANELAKRVVELEEKLKIVTLQRKKAERAAAQVLSILESNGINDLSEEYYSGSDEDGAPIESKESSPFMKEGKSVMASWKNCGSSSSVENKKHFSRSRGLSSPVSDGVSSMKQHSGKSSCTMKQKEIRSAADKERNDPHVLEVQENGALSQYGDDDNFENILKGDAKDEETKASLEALAPDSLEEQRQETNGGLFFNGNRRDANMERALEHQAQLIGRYEEEEDTQREWEAKFGETNSTHDYCEPGNQSDITEECDEVREEEKNEVKEEAIETAKTSSPHEQRVNLGVEQVWHAEAMTETVPNNILPSHFDCGCSQDQQGNNLTANKSKTSMLNFSVQEQEKPKSESNRKQEQLENSLLQTPLSLSVEHQPIHKTSSFNEDSSLRKGESSGVQNELQTVVAHHGAPTGLGGVLEALQLAKLSLNHRLNSLPLPTQSRPVEREKETPVLAIEGSNSTTEIPVKSDGFFQVPSSSQIKAAATRTNVSGTYSDPRSSLMRQYPSAGVGVAGDYNTNMEMPITSQFEATTHHQMNLLGAYPDSRFNFSGSYPSPELGFAADHHPNLSRPTSSQWEATDIQRNLLKTYPDSRSSMTRYYPSPEILVATNKHTNSEMGFGISNHRSLIDPYMNTGIGQSAYGRYTYPSYADYASRTPTRDEFSSSYTSVGSGMPAEDSSSAYDSRFRWNMHHR